MGNAVGQRMGRPDGALLLGRRSYEEMLASWNSRGGPFKDALNNAPKYVASRTLHELLLWPNSTLLDADVAAAVAQLKRDLSGGSNRDGQRRFAPDADRHDLIDEYLLSITPVVFGTGRRCSPRAVHQHPFASWTAASRAPA